MKNRDVFKMLEGFKKVQNFEGVEFSVCIAENTDLLEDKAEKLRVGAKPSEEFTKYDAERIEISKRYATKDKDGMPEVKQIKNNDGEVVHEYYELTDTDKALEEVKKLNSKYKGVIEKREKQLKDFEKLLDKDCSLELYKIDKDELPEDITPELLRPIYHIIKKK